MPLMNRSLHETDNGQAQDCSSYLVTFLQAAGDNREYCESVADAYFGVGCLQTSNSSQNDCCKILKSQYDISCRKNGYFESSNLLIVVLVLLTCALVTSLIRKNHLHWLPEAGGCIIVGAVIGGILQALPSVDVDKFEFDEDFFLSILLPPIIFDAALSVSKTEFRKRKFPIIMFAVIGTILSTFFTGYLVHYGSSWLSSASTIPILDSLVFGALISSIDPVAILSVLSSLNMGQKDTIFILIFGESLLNDGVAITMFHALVGEYQEGTLSVGPNTILSVLVQSLVVGFGSIFIGTLSGVLCISYFYLLKGVLAPAVEVLSFFLWAVIPYYVADAFDLSGIVAIVAMGFLMDLYIADSKRNVSSENLDGSFDVQKSISVDSLESAGGGQLKANPVSFSTPTGEHYIRLTDAELTRTSILSTLFREKCGLSHKGDKHIRFVSHLLAHIAENSIFVYLGIFLFGEQYKWDIYLLSVSIVSCVIGRFVMVIIVSSLVWYFHTVFWRCLEGPSETREANATVKALQDSKVRTVLVLAGLRGAVSLALVESLPIYDEMTGHGSQYKPELKAMTSAAIIFTVFIFGGTAYYVLRVLGIQTSMESFGDEKFSNERKQASANVIINSC
jgi:NhaP-type Na+/H+ or K+/H+ antiporter